MTVRDRQKCNKLMTMVMMMNEVGDDGGDEDDGDERGTTMWAQCCYESLLANSTTNLVGNHSTESLVSERGGMTSKIAFYAMSVH